MQNQLTELLCIVFYFFISDPATHAAAYPTTHTSTHATYRDPTTYTAPSEFAECQCLAMLDYNPIELNCFPLFSIQTPPPTPPPVSFALPHDLSCSQI